MKRKALSKKSRFEVFKRDKFACQYCGAKAPDVVLVVDHVHPVAKGGGSDPLNLITACQPCNSGKGPRELGDSTELEKQRGQLEELQERREQLDMMLAWKRGLLDIDGDSTRELSAVWSKLVAGYSLNEGCTHHLSGLVTKYGAADVLEAMKIAVDSYLRFGGEKSGPTFESVCKAWKSIAGILWTKKEEASRPYLRDLYRVRYSACKRIPDLDSRSATIALEHAFKAGFSSDQIQLATSNCWSWSAWIHAVEDLYNA